MKLFVPAFLFISIFLVLSCKKKDSSEPAPYTNTGIGTVDYNGKDTLAVKAYDGSTFLMQGNSIPHQSAVVQVSVAFPKGRPKDGYYTPVKDNITVSIIGSSTLYWSMREDDTITVTNSGNTLNASFKKATFDLLGYSNTSNKYTGILTSN